jgi:phosphate:Na+ symporter
VLPVFLRIAGERATEAGDLTIAIAAYHTGFNLIAVALLLPAAGAFAALVVRILPERGPTWSQNLDVSVAELGPVAVEAARRATVEIGALILDAARHLLLGDEQRARVLRSLDAAEAGLNETRAFLGVVRTSRSAPAEYRRHLSVLHALDHFERMSRSLRDEQPFRVLGGDPDLRAFGRELAEHLAQSLGWLRGDAV